MLCRATNFCISVAFNLFAEVASSCVLDILVLYFHKICYVLSCTLIVKMTRLLVLTVYLISTIYRSALALEKHSLQCPNVVPKGFPQPSENIEDFRGQFRDCNKNEDCKINGVSPNINPVGFESNGDYAQYQAAKSLVPCDETPVSVFIPSSVMEGQANPVGRYSVAISYSAFPVKNEIKKWLKEKYDASQTNNPIRDALKEKGLHSLPYDVDGHTILDTLCPNTIQVIEERCDGGPRNETRECCTETNPCKEGQGDCDTDEECRGDLICGRNNCGSKFSWDSADCCEKSKFPKTTISTTTTTTTTTTKTPAIEEPQSSNTLPNGWTQHYDSSSGKFYYYDPYTKNYFIYHGGERYIARQKREAPSLRQRVFSFFGGLFGYGSEDNPEFEKQHFKRDAPHPFVYSPTQNPDYYRPHSSAYQPEVPYQEASYYQPASFHYSQNAYPHEATNHHVSSYPQQAPTHHPQPAYQPEVTYHKPEPYQHIDYYHPPEPKFKLRIRTRRDFSCCADDSNLDLGVCTDLKDECKDMMTSKKMFNGKMVSQMVDCKNTFRFTDLEDPKCGPDAGWIDCVGEDEDYLEEIDFYGACEEGDGECFKNRRLPMDPTNPLIQDDPMNVFYPGYKEATECKTPYKVKRDLDLYTETNVETVEQRVRRDVPRPYSYHEPKEESLWVRQVSQCRVIVAKGGDVHKRCDRIAETRPLDYKTAITLFPPGTDLSHDASDFDLFEF